MLQITLKNRTLKYWLRIYIGILKCNGASPIIYKNINSLDLDKFQESPCKCQKLQNSADPLNSYAMSVKSDC